MYTFAEAAARLRDIAGVSVREGAPLSRYTRFEIGGPARYLVEAADEGAFVEAFRAARDTAHVVIGGGTNLVVSDNGFDGIVLRFTGSAIEQSGTCVRAAAGGDLQALVDYSVAHGLGGLETMTGIPGTVGGAVYGNAGAYGRSICESVRRVRFFDGAEVREIGNADCEFRYRESVFKRNKGWVVLSAELLLETAPAAELARVADDILSVRNRKYPPTMKCAGSIFKNLILGELDAPVRAVVPAGVVREGKVPSAWFLEQVGAKGMKNGDIHVADYHANLIYNAGTGTAAQVVEVIADLKARVRERFGLELEEEVQYVGFG
jgi:UDP-N-acetylmuramate dehydrogenase